MKKEIDNKSTEKINQDSATPAHNQQVISACAFIHHNFNGVYKLFLPKRAELKKFLPGVYELPGGHIDFGEDIIDGLKREIKEEHNMNITVGDPFYVYTYKNHVKGSHSVEVIYFAQFVEPINQVNINPEDHSTYGWFTKDEIFNIRNEIVIETQVTHNHSDDPEYLAMLRGFELLEGGLLRLK